MESNRFETVCSLADSVFACLALASGMHRIWKQQLNDYIMFLLLLLLTS